MSIPQRLGVVLLLAFFLIVNGLEVMQYPYSQNATMISSSTVVGDATTATDTAFQNLTVCSQTADRRKRHLVPRQALTPCLHNAGFYSGCRNAGNKMCCAQVNTDPRQPTGCCAVIICCKQTSLMCNNCNPGSLCGGVSTCGRTETCCGTPGIDCCSDDDPSSTMTTTPPTTTTTTTLSTGAIVGISIGSVVAAILLAVAAQKTCHRCRKPRKPRKPRRKKDQDKEKQEEEGRDEKRAEEEQKK